MIASCEQAAVGILAPALVVDLAAVADIEAALSAVAPDRMLHETRKALWEALVERARIDGLGCVADDIGTATWPITGTAIGVTGIQALQNTRSMQQIVHQRVDCDHAGPGFEPQGAVPAGAEQQVCAGHVQHLVGYAIDVTQWPNQSFS